MRGQWQQVNYKTKHPLQLAQRALKLLHIVVTNSLVWTTDWRATLNLKEMYNFYLSIFTIFANNIVYTERLAKFLETGDVSLFTLST